MAVTIAINPKSKGVKIRASTIVKAIPKRN
jgi:hypothetical protein